MKPLRIILFLTALIGTSQAAIIYSGTQNIIIPTTFVGVYLDIDGGGTVAEEGAGWDVNPFFGGEGVASSPSFQAVTTTIVLDAPIMNLSAGQSISAASTFASTHPGGFSASETHVGNSAGQFPSGVEGYIGFKFTTNSSAGPYYGWMRVVLSNTASTGLVKDWAYENSGASILVAAVPEPSVFAVLLIGGAGFCFRRRR
jgi:hypothetical protein